MNAFVSSGTALGASCFTSSTGFGSVAANQKSCVYLAVPPRRSHGSSVKMSLWSSGAQSLLSQYLKMTDADYEPEYTYANDDGIDTAAPVVFSAEMEKVLGRYRDMVPPTIVRKYGAVLPITYESMMSDLQHFARAHYNPGMKPIVSKADEYMAKCVGQQYKYSGCSSGVYSVRCTEGTTKHQAEDARVLSLGTSFRAQQRGNVSQFGTMFDMRRRAVALSHGCSYEETLQCQFPGTAMATVSGQTESIGACARLATAGSVEEGYMMRSVEQQCKSQSVKTGVYGTTCTDGTTKGMAEFRRVTAMSAKFRAGQWSELAKTQRSFDWRKHARQTYGHLCSYEEDLFNKYPNMAASMSGEGARY